MKAKSRTKAKQKLPKKVKELPGRLDETEETLAAIQDGGAHGLHKSASGGDQVPTLSRFDSLYRVMIEEMSDGAFIMASDGTILYCNTRFAAMLRRPLDKVIHSPISNFTAREDKAKLDASFTKARVDKVSVETSLLGGDGSRALVCLSLNSVKVGDSQVICAVVTDLSEQKQNERVVQGAKLANSILSQSTEAILICDENGRIIQVSQDAHRQIPGKLLRQAFDAVCPLSIASPSPLQPAQFSVSAILSGKIIRSLEVTYRREDTTESHFLLSARPLTHDGKRIIGCVVSLVDITGRKQVEAELTRLASFPRLNPNPIVEVDLLGQVHYSNPSAEQLFPDLRKEGLNHPSLVDLKDVAKALEINFRSPYVREIKVGDSWYQQRIHAVLEGTRLRIYGFDITERKRAEEELRESEQRLRYAHELLEAVTSGTNVIMAAQDLNLRYTFFNTAYAAEIKRLTGKDIRIGSSLAELFADQPDQLALAEREWREPLAGKTTNKWLEFGDPDRHRRFYNILHTPIRDTNSLVVGAGEVAYDITDYVQAEQALRESEERTTAILRSISDGFLTINNDMVVTDFNQAAEHLVGIKRGDILGRNILETFPEAKGSIFEEKYTWTLENKKAAAFETYFGIAPYENWYDVRIYPHEYGVSAYFRVTTEEKKAAEAIRKAKERFELLSETASKLLETNNPQGLVNELCEKVMVYLDCHAFFNYLADENVKRLHLNAYTGIPEQTAKDIEWLDYGVAVSGCAVRDAARIVCENIPVTPDPRTELVKSFGIKAYACHPLFSEGRVIGTLSFGTRTRTTFAEDELSLMKTVADQVAIAMEGKRLVEALGRSRDELETRVKERTEQLNRANVSLKAERQLFYDVLETIPAYVVLLTPDYHATFANRTFVEHFGESQGRRCFEFLFGRSEPCETCETYSVLKTMAPHEWEWAGPDGRIYFVHDFPFTDVDGSTLILEMGIDITERKRAEEGLISKERQLRFFASQCLTAQETERRRIAAELHDSIASALAGIKFRIEKTAQDVERGVGATEAMKELSSNVAHTIGEVRRIMTDLRPSILDDLGILPALSWFCREFEKTYSHLSVQKQIGISEEDVPERLKIVIFRISQEAMSNIAKHSRASLVDLALQKAGKRLELIVQDNGHGFQVDEVAKGFGLSTMRERTEFSGGTFEVQSTPGKGTVIRASWPIDR